MIAETEERVRHRNRMTVLKKLALALLVYRKQLVIFERAIRTTHLKQ
jgi:hypothetical protein